MQDQIAQLEKRISELESRFSSQGLNFEELVRDNVFFDQDTTTGTTQTATANLVNGHVTIGKIPDHYIKAYFRGNVVLMPVYPQT